MAGNTPRREKDWLEVLMKSLLVCLAGTTCRPIGEKTNRSKCHKGGGVMKPNMLIAVVICLGCSISGCGGYTSPTNSQTAASMTGNWQFTYTKSGSMSLSGTGILTQTGSNFAGTLSITGACVTSGTISGTLSGLSLTGTLTGTNLTINVTGTVDSNYGSANGSYQVMMASSACASVAGDSGTWTGTHTTASGGRYGGVVRPADRMPVQLALNLTIDGGQVSGTATFTNSACLHSMNVAGTLSGVNLELQGNGGTDASVVLSGTTDTEGKILTLNSAVSGTCQAESGVGTLTKVQ
jgi:hypothetical protein